MNFTELVTAAQNRAREHEKAATAESVVADALARHRMAEIARLLQPQVDGIRALPAELMMSPDMLQIEVQREHGTLRIEMFFETKVWKSFLIVWELTKLAAWDEGNRKAATADEALILLAEMIGRHLAGAKPVDDSV